jgi:hypothetical protein
MLIGVGAGACNDGKVDGGNNGRLKAIKTKEVAWLLISQFINA